LLITRAGWGASRAQGGHALTEERFDAIADWVLAQLDESGCAGSRSATPLAVSKRNP
jgi:hypothetical protein